MHKRRTVSVAVDVMVALLVWVALIGAHSLFWGDYDIASGVTGIMGAMVLNGYDRARKREQTHE